ncbi:hypothetical protein O6V14_09495 [Sphingomonas faeni]|uniref:ImuA family protein n=1 Tax=Sphingomonas faeni TaxID=185950 RepID=UPI00335003C0
MNESSALIARLKRIATTGIPAQGDDRADDAWLTGGLAKAQLHEIFATVDDSASGAGFAVASVLAARAAPVMWLRTEASERQGGRLHATGLVEMGLDVSSLVLGLVEDETDLLRAAADAARCHGLGTLLIESWGRAPKIDLTATRRLMLAAEASGVTILSLRIGADPVPSAAASRWQVAACRSRPLEADAPGKPTFDIELLRRRGGQAGLRWRVEWDRDAYIFDQTAFASGDPAALPGAGIPVAADRAAADDAAASVRRTG